MLTLEELLKELDEDAGPEPDFEKGFAAVGRRARRVVIRRRATFALVLALALVTVFVVVRADTDDSPTQIASGRPEVTTPTRPLGSTVPTPNIGPTDSSSLAAVLMASGSLNNETPEAIASGAAPPRSKCADLLHGFATVHGVLVHQAKTVYSGQVADVLLYRDTADGDYTILVVVPNDKDTPEYDGCRLLVSSSGRESAP